MEPSVNCVVMSLYGTPSSNEVKHWNGNLLTLAIPMIKPNPIGLVVFIWLTNKYTRRHDSIWYITILKATFYIFIYFNKVSLSIPPCAALCIKLSDDLSTLPNLTGGEFGDIREPAKPFHRGKYCYHINISSLSWIPLILFTGFLLLCFKTLQIRYISMRNSLAKFVG